MKLISWNVNGFRACLNKGFSELFREADGDFVCLQETKMQPGQADFHPEDYYEYYNSAEKKGITPAPLFLPVRPWENPSPCTTACRASTTTRDASSLWNTRTSTWCAATCPTLRVS